MLTRLRWRFITAAMLAFFTVIFLVASLVNIVNYCVVTQRADETIDYIMFFEEGRRRPNMPFRALPDEESNYMTRFFIVTVDSQNVILSTSMDYVASVDASEAVSYAKEVLAGNDDHGYIQGYRYAKTENDDKTVIVFLNTTRELQYMRSLLVLTLAVAGVSILLVFLLVVLLSKRAIKPMAHNIELQKRFITDAGHELKTPLTSISTSLEVLEMEHGKDEWTDNIRQQVGRMSGLVSEMVTLSKLDEIKQVPEKETFDLTGATWEMVEVYSPQAKASGKTLKTEIEDGIMFYGEKASIQQMLSVLIDNAIRYSTDNSEIRISVNRNRGKTRIEVFNTCDYQTAPDTERLFERFYRPDESRNKQTGGNGIGLAIARSVAEAHGGRIYAKCPDGRTMTITAEM